MRLMKPNGTIFNRIATIPKFPMPCHKAVTYPFFFEIVTYKTAITSHDN